MDFNYTLRYRTFDSVLEDVSIDMNTLALENMIEPQQLIKIAKKINGISINARVSKVKVGIFATSETAKMAAK